MFGQVIGNGGDQTTLGWGFDAALGSTQACFAYLLGSEWSLSKSQLRNWCLRTVIEESVWRWTKR